MRADFAPEKAAVALNKRTTFPHAVEITPHRDFLLVRFRLAERHVLLRQSTQDVAISTGYHLCSRHSSSISYSLRPPSQVPSSPLLGAPAPCRQKSAGSARAECCTPKMPARCRRAQTRNSSCSGPISSIGSSGIPACRRGSRRSTGCFQRRGNGVRGLVRQTK